MHTVIDIIQTVLSIDQLKSNHQMHKHKPSLEKVRHSTTAMPAMKQPTFTHSAGTVSEHVDNHETKHTRDGQLSDKVRLRSYQS